MKNLTKTDIIIIQKIADRAMAMAMALKSNPKFSRDRISIQMDIECCHESNPLRLDDLLAADDFNFAHDVFGIAKNLNRTTLELENLFNPRFSKKI